MKVRRAAHTEIETLVGMSARIQDALIAEGSLQEFGPLSVAFVASHVAAGTCYVLADGDKILGGVIVAPLTSPGYETLAHWNLDGVECPIWFLEKLMIEPAEQGHHLGDLLLAGVKQVAASHPLHPTIVLDCWAGNEKLRTFYTRNGFRLHGVFGAGGFEVAVFVWDDSGK